MFREWEVSITEYFSSVLRAKIKWKDVYFSCTSQYFLVLLGTSLWVFRNEPKSLSKDEIHVVSPLFKRRKNVLCPLNCEIYEDI